MPVRGGAAPRAQARVGLTEQDVRELREQAAAGRPGTVWFTAVAVGVPAGRSAKVVSVAEPAEGDFIQVRPAGSRDTVFCSPGELSRARPARRRPDPPAPPSGTEPSGAEPPGRVPPAPSRSAAAAPPAADPPAPPTGRRTVSASRAPGDGVPTATTSDPAASDPAASDPAASDPAASDPAASDSAASDPAASGSDPAPPAPAAPAPAARARGGRRAEAATSVRLTATPDGEWQAEVFSGARRVGRAVPVPAADVAVAARALPPAVAEAITAALEGARQRQLERVERLRAELDAAQRALDQLAG